ncbi:MAG: asparaginase [Gemmatimonadetes bacterium]|nr:asparaginase [Gemmatimonadota bacterium]
MPGRLRRAPKVLVIATGGTIAGVQDAPGTLGSYRAGTLTAEQIISSVPELSRFATVEAEQFSNVPSTSITTRQWVALSKRINQVLGAEDLAGVVVTHGTDRLEETAFSSISPCAPTSLLSWSARSVPPPASAPTVRSTSWQPFALRRPLRPWARG